MADGLVDLRTLAGIIGITPAGLDLLKMSLEQASANDVCLGNKGWLHLGRKKVFYTLLWDRCSPY